MGSFGGTGIRLIAAISALRPGDIKSSRLQTRRQTCSLRANHPGAQQLWGAREAAAFNLMAAFWRSNFCQERQRWALSSRHPNFVNGCFGESEAGLGTARLGRILP